MILIEASREHAAVCSLTVFERKAGGTVLRNGNELVHLSKYDFEHLITKKSNCFVCGRHARRNNEHVIPDWIVKRCNLHQEEMLLPQKLGHKFGTYKVPCCIDCNKKLSNELEMPIAEAFALGYDYVKQMADDLDPRLYSWLNFLFLKTHYKDLFVFPRSLIDKRGLSIGENLDWDRFRNSHALVRANIFDIAIRPSAVGSITVLKIRRAEDLPKFAYRDGYDDNTLYIRILDTVIVCVLNDLGASKYFLGPYHKNLEAELDILQSLAVQNEYELASRRLYGRWVPEQEYDLESRSIIMEGVVSEPMGVRTASDALRREGLLYFIRPFVESQGVPEILGRAIFSSVISGEQTYLAADCLQALAGECFNPDWQYLRQQK